MKNKKVIFLSIIVILLLLVNTYAWFIFNKSINLNITSKIKNWSIVFTNNNQKVEEKIDLEIDSLYPGMKEQTKEMEIMNNGELGAEIGYRIIAVEVLGERVSLDKNNTEEQIKQFIEKLPFSINIECDEKTLEPQKGQANFKLSIKWPYEAETDNNEIKSEKDRLDTLYGIKAYEFNNSLENKGKPNFKIEIELVAKQVNN